MFIFYLIVQTCGLEYPYLENLKIMLSLYSTIYHHYIHITKEYSYFSTISHRKIKIFKLLWGLFLGNVLVRLYLRVLQLPNQSQACFYHQLNTRLWLKIVNIKTLLSYIRLFPVVSPPDITLFEFG